MVWGHQLFYGEMFTFKSLHADRLMWLLKLCSMSQRDNSHFFGSLSELWQHFHAVSMLLLTYCTSRCGGEEKSLQNAILHICSMWADRSCIFQLQLASRRAHSQSLEQTQTRRLGINDMTHNHISNQTMTELTNTAWLLIKERKSSGKECERSGKQQPQKTKTKDPRRPWKLLWLITCDVEQLTEINNLHFNNIIIIC